MAAGLGTLMELFDSSPLKKEFIKCLPERNSSRSAGSYLLALATMASSIYGHDCLEDLDEFRNDPSLKSLFGDQTVYIVVLPRQETAKSLNSFGA